jgi:hypothetical protein
MARRNTRAKSNITGSSERTINQKMNNKKISQTMRHAP